MSNRHFCSGIAIEVGHRRADGRVALPMWLGISPLVNLVRGEDDQIRSGNQCGHKRVRWSEDKARVGRSSSDRFQPFAPRMLLGIS